MPRVSRELNHAFNFTVTRHPSPITHHPPPAPGPHNRPPTITHGQNCGQGSEDWNEANYDVYKGLLATDSSLYANRSEVFESDEDGEYGVTAIEYTADTLSDDVRVAYESADYPWIIAVHRFTVEMKVREGRKAPRPSLGQRTPTRPPPRLLCPHSPVGSGIRHRSVRHTGAGRLGRVLGAHGVARLPRRDRRRRPALRRKRPVWSRGFRCDVDKNGPLPVSERHLRVRGAEELANAGQDLLPAVARQRVQRLRVSPGV